MHRPTAPAVRLLVTLLAAALLAGACTDRVTAGDQLDAAIDATRAVPRRLVAVESTPEATYRVTAAIEDDLRTAVRVERDGTPVVDRIVVDDDVALRLLDPAVTPLPDDEPTRERDVTVADALRAGRYVLDRGGAPAEVSTARRDTIGRTLQVLDHVEEAATVAAEVVRWRPDASHPALHPNEDPFPAPTDDEVRFDLRPPTLPGVTALVGGGEPAGVEHVRKLAVYVRDGVVVRILERVEVTGLSAARLRDYLVRAFDESGQPSLAAALRTLDLDDGTSSTLIAQLSTLRERAGQAAIRPFVREVRLVDQGRPDITVELPPDAVEGRLTALDDPLGTWSG